MKRPTTMPSFAMSVAAGVALLLAAGCGPPPPPPPLVERSADVTASALLAGLDARRDAIVTVRGGLEITWEDPRFAEAEDCRGSLSFVRPDSLRLRGHSAAFFTVFDLVAAGRNVWLDVPREEFTVFGSREDEAWSRLPLSPHALMIALLADPCPEEPCLAGARVEEADNAVVLFGAFGRMAFDDATGLPRSYVGAGEDPLRITWIEWSERSGVAWPQRILIERSNAQRLTVSFGRVQLGRPIPGRFHFVEDPSREILTPAEAARRWEIR
ncbi:hypothetical protein K8I85_14320 [bacterium]|nr:hypothetical protein [bacterium]